MKRLLSHIKLLLFLSVGLSILTDCEREPDAIRGERVQGFKLLSPVDKHQITINPAILEQTISFRAEQVTSEIDKSKPISYTLLITTGDDVEFTNPLFKKSITPTSTVSFGELKKMMDDNKLELNKLHLFKWTIVASNKESEQKADVAFSILIENSSAAINTPTLIAPKDGAVFKKLNKLNTNRTITFQWKYPAGEVPKTTFSFLVIKKGGDWLNPIHSKEIAAADIVKKGDSLSVEFTEKYLGVEALGGNNEVQWTIQATQDKKHIRANAHNLVATTTVDFIDAGIDNITAINMVGGGTGLGTDTLVMEKVGNSFYALVSLNMQGVKFISQSGDAYMANDFVKGIAALEPATPDSKGMIPPEETDYVVLFDVENFQLKLTEVTRVALIGAAVKPLEWNGDTALNKIAPNRWTNDFSLVDGEFKFRLNQKWPPDGFAIGKDEAKLSFDPGKGNLSFTGIGTTPSNRKVTLQYVDITGMPKKKQLGYTIEKSTTNTALDSILVLATTTGITTDKELTKSNSDFTGSVFTSLSAIYLKLITQDPNATVKIKGAAENLNKASSSYNFATAKNNQIILVVTAADGTTTKEYTVTLTRQISAELDTVYVTSETKGINTNMRLTKATTSFTGMVTTSTPLSAINLKLVTEDPNATVKVKDAAENLDKASSSHNFATATDNRITLVVTAGDGTTTKEYTVTLTQHISAELDTVYVTSATEGINTNMRLTQATTSSFTGTVTPSTPLSAIYLKLVTEDPNATVKVKDAADNLNKEESSHDFETAAGNQITLVVTAGDRTTTKEYTVTLTQQASAELNEVYITSATDGIMTDMLLTKADASFTGMVTPATPLNAITLKFVTKDPSATVKVKSAAMNLNKDASSHDFAAATDNQITFTVTAGATTKDYTVSLYYTIATVKITFNNGNSADLTKKNDTAWEVLNYEWDGGDSTFTVKTNEGTSAEKQWTGTFPEASSVTTISTPTEGTEAINWFLGIYDFQIETSGANVTAIKASTPIQIIGDFSASNWGSGIRMTPVANHQYEYIIREPAGTRVEFKIRQGDRWDIVNLGNSALNNYAGFTSDGGNIAHTMTSSGADTVRLELHLNNKASGARIRINP